jgi:hypothetical protein
MAASPSHRACIIPSLRYRDATRDVDWHAAIIRAGDEVSLI